MPEVTFPRKISFHDEAYHKGLSDFQREAGVKHAGGLWLVRRSEGERGQFHLIRADWEELWQYYNPREDSYAGVYYQPIHPTMTYDDIEGASYAYDDGTFWHFAHCSPGEHLDFAAEAETFTFNQFAYYLADVNKELAAETDAATKTALHYKGNAILALAYASGRRAHHHVTGHVLGHFHKNPHHDHLREIALVAITAEIADWKAKDRSLDVTRTSAAVTFIVTRLTAEPKIEWREERQARLGREGKDPVDGFEFIYTIQATDDEITETADLPDPAWTFDQLASAGAAGTIRGERIYSDGIPPKVDAFPYVVRFWRTVPHNVAVGDAVTAPWVQDMAYRRI